MKIIKEKGISVMQINNFTRLAARDRCPGLTIDFNGTKDPLARKYMSLGRVEDGVYEIRDIRPGRIAEALPLTFGRVGRYAHSDSSQTSLLLGESVASVAKGVQFYSEWVNIDVPFEAFKKLADEVRNSGQECRVDASPRSLHKIRSEYGAPRLAVVA